MRAGRAVGLFCSFLLFALSASAAIPATERDALLTFYSATNGPGWTDRTGWLGVPGTECSWFGVACDDAQGHIVDLIFFQNNLSGLLPPQISALPELRTLYLYGNHIAGTIPSSIGSLSKLSALSAQGNAFTGSMPDSIGNLTALESLNFNQNKLSGSLPSSVGNLTHLTNIELERNDFSGPIPDSLRNLSSLKYISLSNNRFSGPLPDYLPTFLKLEVLLIGSNELTGPIPDAIGNLTNLVSLDLRQNHLSPTLPASIGALSKLETLNLESIGLAGPIPDAIGNLTSLVELDLSLNQFTGTIPSSIGKLTRLETLKAASNQLSGGFPDAIGSLTALVNLDLSGNLLTGAIPASIGTFSKLATLSLNSNKLTGQVPDIGNLTNLLNLDLSENQLSGTLPNSLGNLRKLSGLYLGGNRLTGEVPPGVWGLPKMVVLYIYYNDFTGTVPPTIGDSPDMEGIALYGNRFSGPLPDVFDRMPKLTYFNVGNNDFTGTFPRTLLKAPLGGVLLYANRFTGPIPPELGDKADLDNLALGGNQFTGTIPPELGKLTKLRYLWLGGNLLTGSIPESLGQLRMLDWLALYGNQLRGEVPSSLLNLTNTASIDLGDNALRTSNPALLTLLEQRGSFLSRQTLPPTNVAVQSVSSFTALLGWTPIAYQSEAGGYQVLASTTQGGPYTPLITTPTKSNASALVTGLQPSTRYYFIVQAVTYPHGGTPFYQLSTIFSDPSNEVAATTLVQTTQPAEVIVTTFPFGILQSPDGGGTDSYTLTNIGGTAATVTLSQSGSFFQQSPATFTLESGASQAIALTGLPVAVGEYNGSSLPSGSGTPSGLNIGIRLVSLTPQSAGFKITSERSRIDLVAPAEINPSGTLTFRNSGTATFQGVASADVQFLVPQQGLIIIPPGGTAEVSVMSDRSKRPDAAALSGTQEGHVALVAIGGFTTKTPFGNGSASSLVGVVDTVKPPTTTAGIPPLVSGEVALFLSSVGHVVGSVGEFLSDISIVNAYGTAPASDVKLFYTRSGASTSSVTSVAPIGNSQALALADVVKSVFGGTAEVGTLQIRSSKSVNLSVSANIFNSSNKAGNYGTAIPVLRSDRAVVTGGQLLITGLRRDGSSHTNLYLQEVRGLPVMATIEFLSADGRILLSRTDTVPPFALVTLVNQLPLGSIAARIRNVSGGGSVGAYGTPVDEASGDTWAVADWSLYYGYDPGSPIVFPVAGAVRGANGTFFRTDVAITNRCDVFVGDDPALLRSTPCRGRVSTGTLRYITTTGQSYDKQIALGLLETLVMTDVVKSVFGITTDTIGHLVFIPAAGSFAATSRTYTTTEGSVATYGTAVPALGLSNSIRPGQTRRIGALSDSTTATIVRATPASYRTNYGIVETAGEAARVRVSVFFDDPRSLASGKALGSRIFDLSPNQFISVSNLVRSIVGEARETLYGDLHGVQVQFDVVSTTGAVTIYTSSIDNGTGDAILRTE